MATLVSPGVSVTLENESFYATAGVGTVPLIVIATAEDKFQPGSSTALASGTIKSEAGKLRLITSQRDALQTYGIPNFYSVSGTPQFDNELNELGLFALYNYLGIANSAYVLRADVDLNQLAPTSVEPVGLPNNGDYWLDLGQTTYGLFTSNGDSNSAYSWKSKSPIVISDKEYLERIVQGNIQNPAPLPSAIQELITQNGILSINNVNIPLVSGDTLTTVVNKINNSRELRSLGISATTFVRVQKFTSSGLLLNGMIYGDVYNLRIKSVDSDVDIVLSGTTPSILTNLGFSNTLPVNVVVPIDSIGEEGDFAVDTYTTSEIDAVSGSHEIKIWQKISLVTTTGTKGWWFNVGSTDETFPGWGWREANPRVITGTVPNPIFTLGESANISVGTQEVNISADNDLTLAGFVSNINSQFNTVGINAIARRKAVGLNSYLEIVNFDSSDIWIHDNSSINGIAKPLGNAGISTSTEFFGSIQGTTSNPSFTAPSMFVNGVSVTNSGNGYVVGDEVTVEGGSPSANLKVETVTVVNTSVVNGGTGYNVRDTLTLTGNGFLSPIILRVDSIGNNGTITGVSIIQKGQYNNISIAPPTANVSINVTSGSGINATFNLYWGASTLNIVDSGTYSIFPASPYTDLTESPSISAGCSFNLQKGFTSADSFTINLGSNVTRTVYVTGTTIDSVVSSINETWPEFTNIGRPVASKITVGSNNYLKITNPNGTRFVLNDVSGTPLKKSGIPVGYRFGKQLIYKGYSPSLQVPKSPAELAVDNVWINTTAQNRGLKFVLKQYRNGVWTPLNIVPNTGNIPVYSSTAIADNAFGSLKATGSVFVQYNSNNKTPAEASFVIKRWDGTAWLPMIYTASSLPPTGRIEDGTYWYNTDLMTDIMVSDGQNWIGYRNMYPGTDPNGPILDASEPLEQSNGSPLADYDIWIDTSDTLNYPRIYRYQSSTSSWILIDKTDQSSSAGIIFKDARPNANGTRTGSMIPSAMVLSNYVDEDAPDARLYPDGLLLFNTRYSTNNIKVWRKNYFNVENYPNVSWRDRWVTLSGNDPTGIPYMGNQAQRNVIVRALKEAIESNQEIRAEQSTFNLIACPGYIETFADMVKLNTDKKETAFVIVDPPARLDPSSISIQHWATNYNGAPLDGPDGLITRHRYAGMYYPWALATNLDGNTVFVPPSVVALRTYAYNDQVAYPWFAPAGFNRGLVTGVSSVGYLTSDNTFQFLQLNQGQRDILYLNSINPIAFIPNRGLVVYGQKTLAQIPSAPDRINVARLINYLNYQLDLLAKPYLFEPNDELTRQSVTTAFNSFMGGLVGQRALYDFAVVCDGTNNTPARIDRNELWIDIAIKPEKAIEFIYIPIRLLNTGDPLPGSIRAA